VSTALDTAIRKVVKAVARPLGTTITLRTVTAGTYSTSTGGASDTTVDLDVEGFILTENDLDALGLVMVADRAVLLLALAVTTAPTTADRFLIGTDVYEITQVDNQSVRDDRAYYVLHGKGTP
jgi:hypothetical protein